MFENSKLSLKKIFISALIPVAVAIVLYSVYDFSLRSYVTFVVYTLLGICSLASIMYLVSNAKALTKAFVFFETTYLSVYLFSIFLGLNTNLFDFIKGIAFSLVSFSTCALIASYIKSTNNSILAKVLKVIFTIVLFAFVLLPAILICYLIATGSLISSDIIIALAQTNPTEGSEFFMSNVNYKWGLALAALIFIFYINLWSFRSVSSLKKGTNLALVSLLLVLISSIFLALPRMDYLPFSVIKVTSKQLNNFDIYKQKKAERLEKLKNLTSICLRQDVDSKGNLFVLVIGESETRDRMQAYGYERKNTPFLVQALKNPNNVLFENTFTSWPQTVQALSYALTESNQYRKKEVADAFSLLEVARAAGYQTYWLSNQRKYGVFETPITVISSTAHHEIWTNGSSKMEGVFFDEELVNRFPEIDPSTNTFIIVHLMGSHQKYDKRLPGDYFVYSGDDKVDDYYDDTILYTDHIVNEIYSKVSKASNFKGMIYFSDHGENPHIVGGHDPVNVCGQMLRVPFIVYMSDKFVSQRPETYESLKENKSKYFSNDLMFNFIVDFLGIDGLPSTEDELNISSKKYSLKQNDVLTMYGKKHINEYLFDKIEKK